MRIAILWLGMIFAGTGCFLDEIDKAGEWQKPKNAAAEPVQDPEPPQPAAATRPNWWATAKSLGSEESSAEIVQCSVGNTTQFMGRDDCLARGGSIK
jgi:hypothetical protein